MMTGADLCASTKPWHYQRETVQVIFEEFYSQVLAQLTRQQLTNACGGLQVLAMTCKYLHVL